MIITNIIRTLILPSKPTRKKDNWQQFTKGKRRKPKEKFMCILPEYHNSHKNTDYYVIIPRGQNNIADTQIKFKYCKAKQQMAKWNK